MLDVITIIASLWNDGGICKFLLEKGIGTGLVWLYRKLKPRPIDKAFKNALKRWDTHHYVKGYYKEHKLETLEDFANYIHTRTDLHEDSDMDEFFGLFEDELKKDEDTYQLLIELRTKAIELGIDEIIKGVTDGVAILDEHKKLFNEISRKLSSFNKGIRCFSKPKPYLKRYCSFRMNMDEYVIALIEHKDVESHTLTDYVVGNTECAGNKYILYGEAQCGKSTELMKLGYDLQQGGMFVPVLFEVGGHMNLMNDLPALSDDEDKKVVLIIDALDERFDSEQRNQLYNEVETYAKEHPNMKIVMSCRSNLSKEFKSSQYKPLSLDDLRVDDVETYLRSKGMGNLLAEAERKGLMLVMRRPFCLLAMVDYYADKKALPKNIPALYDYFIDRKLKVEENKSLRRSNIKLRKSKTFLMRLAVAQQMLKKNGLTEEEVAILGGDDPELLDATLRTSLLEVTDEKGCAFTHNSFKEHLVAKYLISLDDLTRIEEYCCYRGTKRVMDEWHHTMALLASNLPAKGNLSEQVVDWIANENRELVQYVEKERMTESQRSNIFIEILEDCKRKNTRYNDFYTSKYQELMDFGFSSKSLNYLKKELNDCKERNSHMVNLLFLIRYLPWGELSEAKKVEMKRLLLRVFGRLIKTEDTSFPLFTALGNPYLYNKETVGRVYALVKDITLPDVVTEFMDYVNDAGQTEDYMDEIIGMSSHVHDYRRHGATCCVRKEHLYEAYKRAKSWETIKKVMQQLAKNVSEHGFYYDNDIRDFHEMMHILLGRVAEMENERHEKSDFVYDILVEMAEEKREVSKLGADPFADYFDKVGLADHYFRESLKNLHEKMFNRQEWGEDSMNYHKTMESYAYCTSLLLTENRVEEIVSKYGTNSQEGYHVLSWVESTASAETKELIEVILKNRYPSYWIDPEKPTKWELRDQKNYDELMNYDEFKKKVLKVIEEKTPRNREDVKSLRRVRVEFSDGEYDRISQYVFGVLHLFYEYNGSSINLEGAKNFVCDVRCYHKYAVEKTLQRLHNENKKKSLTDEQMALYQVELKEWLTELSEAPFAGENAYQSPAIQALLYGDVSIEKDLLIKLLPYSFCHIHVRDDKPYSVRDYTLFEYIREQYTDDEIGLRQALHDCMEKREFLIELNQKVWGDYLVRQGINSEYLRVIGWLYTMDNSDPAYTLIKALVENADTRTIMKKTTTLKRLSVEKRQFVYEMLASERNEDDFVKRGLEKLFGKDGCDKNLVARYLIARGSIKGLRYLSEHTELFMHNLALHYKTVSALPILVKLYVDTKDKEPRHDYSCLLNAMEEIAFDQEAKHYERVRKTLVKLKEKDKKYVNLNYYLDKWETRYLDMKTGEMDIYVVKKLMVS